MSLRNLCWAIGLCTVSAAPLSATPPPDAGTQLAPKPEPKTEEAPDPELLKRLELLEQLELVEDLDLLMDESK